MSDLASLPMFARLYVGVVFKSGKSKGDNGTNVGTPIQIKISFEKSLQTLSIGWQCKDLFIA
jgi:hypothetical protein